MTRVYFIGTKHKRYAQANYLFDSTVIDPWRYIPDAPNYKVHRIGENKPAMISLLVPSRGRPQMFRRLYESFMETVTYPQHVEMIAWIDDDDEEWPKYPYSYPFRDANRDELRERYRLHYLRGERRLLSECWNECYAHARGEILMHCGDDLTFNTVGWDQRVREEFAKLPDRIGLVFGDDLSTNFPDLATHGFLHRRWIDAVGYFLPPLFSSDWNDVWISEVAKQIGRMVPMPDVIIEHHHYTFGKAERDKTHAEREERGARDDVVNLFKRTANERKSDAAKLKKVMA